MLQPKIHLVEPMDKYRLKLRYETGEIRVFNVLPYMSGGWFGELGDDKYFGTVRVINDGGGIAWENGQDIAPHELYDLSEQAQ